MDTSRKVFGNSGPTLGAELRGIIGRHFDDYPGSFFRFPGEYLEEPEPSGVSHRPVEWRCAIPGIHPLDTDSVIVFDKLVGQLEVEVPPLVRNFLVCFGHQQPGLLPSVRAFNSPGEPLLSHGEHISGLLEKARILYLHAIRGSQEGLKSDIYAHRPTCRGEWSQGHVLTGEANVPLAGRSPADGDCLDSTLDWAGKAQLESTYISDSEIPAVEFPAGLLQCEAVVAIPALEPGEARFTIAILYSPEKSLIGFIQTFKHILEHLRAYFSIFWKGYFKSGKLFYLVEGENGMAVMAVGSDTLLQGGIVELAAQRKPTFSFLNRLRVGLNSVLKRLFPLHDTIIANLEKGTKPYRASPSVSPALKCGVLDGGTL